jgi:hypothetical protein
LQFFLFRFIDLAMDYRSRHGLEFEDAGAAALDGGLHGLALRRAA